MVKALNLQLQQGSQIFRFLLGGGGGGLFGVVGGGRGCKKLSYLLIYSRSYKLQKERGPPKKRQADRHRQTDRQTDRQRDRQRVSNLMFYAQSPITAISGRNDKERFENSLCVCVCVCVCVRVWIHMGGGGGAKGGSLVLVEADTFKSDAV